MNGNNTEKLLEFGFDYEVLTIKELHQKYKTFIQRLERRIRKPLLKGRFWLYDAKYRVRCHLWLKCLDGTELIIDQAMLDSIWTEGPSKVIEITKDNREELASYHKWGKIEMNFYPANLQIFTLLPKDKAIIVKGISDTHLALEKEVKKRRMQATYLDTKSTTVIKNNRQELQKVTTYETYEKIAIRLNKTTKGKTYKKNKNK